MQVRPQERGRCVGGVGRDHRGEREEEDVEGEEDREGRRRVAGDVAPKSDSQGGEEVVASSPRRRVTARTWINLRPSKKEGDDRMFCCACGKMYATADECPEGHTKTYVEQWAQTAPDED